MRPSPPPLALAALLAFAACDSAPAGDPVVGTWAATETVSETWVVSRVDQDVPDVPAAAGGAVAVTGRVERTLGAVTGLRRSRVSLAMAATATGSNPTLTLSEEPFLASARFDVDRGDAPGDVYEAHLPGTTDLFHYADGRLTVADVELVRQDGTGHRVRVGSTTVSVPTRALRAGAETRVGSDTTPIAGQTLAFQADGTAVRTRGTGPAATSETGRWERTGPDAVTVTFDGVPRALGVDGDALTLTWSSRGDCDAACRARAEDRLVAAPGSLAEAWDRSATTYRRR